jgi:DNA-directed RNA polymerase specialized sigma24 family protein
VQRAVRERAGQQRAEEVEIAADPDSTAVDRRVVAEERDIVLRAAFAQLPAHCRELLGLLLSDPPTPYTEISAKLDLPVGSIGPNRARCLQRLRRCPAILVLLGEGDNGEG